MIRLVAFDLDGTLLDDSYKASPATWQTLRRLGAEPDLTLAAVSGRSVRRCLEPLAACPELLPQLYACGYNGAVAVGPQRQGRRPKLFEQRLSAQVFAQVIDYVHRCDLNLVYCRCESGADGLIEEYRHVRHTAATQDLWQGPGFVLDPHLIQRVRSGELGIPPKIMLLTDPGQRDVHIDGLQRLVGDQIYMTWPMDDRFEILHPAVDKGLAIRTLAAHSGVPLEQIMAIGDGHNDLPMLRQAGLGVLMGDAKEKVRRQTADTDIQLAPPFAQDGFSWAVERHVLGHG